MLTTPVTDAQMELFSAWRALALGRMPYMASYLFGVRVLNAPGLGTFAVDPGFRLYVDFDAVAERGSDWCSESLLHEVGHLFGEHSRFAQDLGVSPELAKTWNVACFPAGTLLPGGVPIESVATMERDYDGELVQVITTGGRIEATTEHPFYVRRRRHKKGVHPIVLNEAEWMEAQEIREGDYLCVPKLSDKRADTVIDLRGYITQGRDGLGRDTFGNRAVKQIPLTEDVAWLIGLYVAEGSSSPHVRFSLGAHEDDIIEKVERVVADIGYSSSRSYSRSSGAVAVTVGAVVLGRWLKEHCGAVAAEKHVPDVILRHADPAIRRGFLRGLRDGDGCDYRQNPGVPTTKVETSSQALMHDLILLLAQDGIGGRAYTRQQRAGRRIRERVLPAGILYGVQWNPDGCRPTPRTLNGHTVMSCAHRWKADDEGVWYPVKDVKRRAFSGRVYNMTTESHTYITHGFLVHNCDFSLNDDLVEVGCLTLSDMVPSIVGMPEHLTANDYFLRLVAMQQQQGGGQQQQGSGSGQQQQGSGGGQQQDGEPFAGCGSASGGPAAPCELDPDDDADGHAPAATPGERARVRLATAKLIIEHASRGRGTVPAGMVEQANMILTPTSTPWQKLLGAALRRALRYRAGLTNPNHTARDRRRNNVRLSPNGPKVIFPGRRTPVLRMAVVRDTSGSMGPEELETVTREIVTIARKLRIRGTDLMVLDVDADVHSARGFGNGHALQQVHGRGGTDMRVGIAEALRQRGGVDAIAVLTDGGTPWPDEPTPVPVVACLVGPYARELAPEVPSWIRSVVVDTPGGGSR